MCIQFQKACIVWTIKRLLALTYSDDNFRKIINAILYKYSTILKLSELLARLGIENSCMDIYQNFGGHVK